MFRDCSDKKLCTDLVFLSRLWTEPQHVAVIIRLHDEIIICNVKFCFIYSFAIQLYVVSYLVDKPVKDSSELSSVRGLL